MATLATVHTVVVRILIAKAVFKIMGSCQSIILIRSVDDGAISIENEHFNVNELFLKRNIGTP